MKKKWVIEFPYEIIFNYMKAQANSITEIINNINSKEEIKSIIFVGGYCSNEILLNLIKNNLKKIKTYLQPSYPSLAIMEGAVLFGIEPSAINIRKAKYTIGKSVYMIWDDNKHSGKGKKLFFEDFNEWVCQDCFSKFIEINQDLKYEESISQESYTKKGSNKIKMEFFKATKANPIFTFEEGVIKIGECFLDIGKAYENLEDRKTKTILKFGGTFIDVTGIHLKSGKSVKTTLNFD